jgi:hypothetical protein
MIKSELKVIVLYDGVLQFHIYLPTKMTIAEFKNLIVQKLGLYSVNYLIMYNDRDYSKFDSFAFHQIFIPLTLDKDYAINLINIETYVRERQSQRVIISYEEGGEELFIYNLLKKKFETAKAEKSKGVRFDKFPFNSRAVNMKKENRLVISGGQQYETGICSYDYDTNYIIEHPDCRNPRIFHSLINLGDLVFLIGGSNCKEVDCFNMNFEDWTDYPALNYDRKDPCVCLVDEKILYVFFGYSINLGGIVSNVEYLDIQEKPYSAQWVNTIILNPSEYPIQKSNLGVVNYNEGFIILGGMTNYKSEKEVFYLNRRNFKIDYDGFCLPTEAAFAEKEMFSIDDKNFYLVIYGARNIIHFDKEKFKFSIILENLDKI